MDTQRDAFKIRISKYKAKMWIFIVMLTLPHMNPSYFNQMPLLEKVVDGWKLASFSIIMLWLFLVKRKTPLLVFLIGIQQIYIFAVTVFLGGAVYGCAVSVFSVLSVVLLYTITINHRERDVFFSAQLFCFEVVIYINLITVVMYPNGMYTAHGSLFASSKNYFLGYYNNLSQYFIPALMFAWLYMLYTGKKLRTYLLTSAIFGTAFMVWSGGLIISLFGMAIIYVFFKNRTAIFNGYTYWGSHVVFLISVPILMAQKWFHWLLSDILGKWGSFLLRLKLWERVLALISASPIVGHGIKDGISREIENGFNFAMHAHNMVLEILYQGGIINLILWIAIIAVSGRVIWKYRNTMESKLIATAWGGWCIATFVEPFATPFLMGMFVVAYYSNPEYAVRNVSVVTVDEIYESE